MWLVCFCNGFVGENGDSLLVFVTVELLKVFTFNSFQMALLKSQNVTFLRVYSTLTCSTAGAGISAETNQWKCKTRRARGVERTTMVNGWDIFISCQLGSPLESIIALLVSVLGLDFIASKNYIPRDSNHGIKRVSANAINA